MLARLTHGMQDAVRVTMSVCPAAPAGAWLCTYSLHETTYDLLSTRGAALAQRNAPHRPSGAPPAALALLGVTIRTQRKRRGLTQKTLAAATGLSPTYIREIEQGQRNVTVLTLLRLAAALQISSALLLQPLEAQPELVRPARQDTASE